MGDTRLIRDILNDEPRGRYNLVYADRLQSGLKRLAEGGIDAVLLDLSLPDSHGIDTFNRARAHSPHVPIVVLTGLDDQSVAVEILRAGGQDYLNKGVLDLLALHRTIGNSIERMRAKEQSPQINEILRAAGHAEDQFVTLLCDELRRRLTPLGSNRPALTGGNDTTAELYPLPMREGRGRLSWDLCRPGDLQENCRGPRRPNLVRVRIGSGPVRLLRDAGRRGRALSARSNGERHLIASHLAGACPEKPRRPRATILWGPPGA